MPVESAASRDFGGAIFMVAGLTSHEKSMHFGWDKAANRNRRRFLHANDGAAIL
jgi:hypothetical protein